MREGQSIYEEGGARGLGLVVDAVIATVRRL